MGATKRPPSEAYTHLVRWVRSRCLNYTRIRRFKANVERRKELIIPLYSLNWVSKASLIAGGIWVDFRVFGSKKTSVVS